MIRLFNVAHFLILSVLLLFPSLLLTANSDLPANFTTIVQTGENNLLEGNEANISECQEEAIRNNFERYLMEADKNEGKAEMKIYAETMTQINFGIENIEKLEKRLLDARVKYPQSCHIQEALGWFYQRMYESSNDKSKLEKAVDAFIRAENLHFENSPLKLHSKYSDLVSKILITLNERYFQVINTGGYAGLQFKKYTSRSVQVFLDVFNTIPSRNRYRYLSSSLRLWYLFTSASRLFAIFDIVCALIPSPSSGRNASPVSRVDAPYKNIFIKAASTSSILCWYLGIISLL
jgi:hypothetical protein